MGDGTERTKTGRWAVLGKVSGIFPGQGGTEATIATGDGKQVRICGLDSDQARSLAAEMSAGDEVLVIGTAT